MKLRNKKTGEIVDLSEGFIRDTYNGEMIQIKPVAISNKEGYVYGSLAELNEEWEDYEESIKPYWFINDLDGEPMKCDLKNCGKSNFIEWSEHRKQIGNYFETEEEAEQAVEKLKAWKRLKENNIHLIYDEEDFESGLPTISIRFGSNYNQHIEIMNEKIKKDLDLLFGVKNE